MNFDYLSNVKLVSIVQNKTQYSSVLFIQNFGHKTDLLDLKILYRKSLFFSRPLVVKNLVTLYRAEIDLNFFLAKSFCSIVMFTG